jgi:hypothetical protein
MKARALVAVIVVGLAASVVGCYDPGLRDCVIACGSGGECPSGKVCSGGLCSSGRQCQSDGPAETSDVGQEAPAFTDGPADVVDGPADADATSDTGGAAADVVDAEADQVDGAGADANGAPEVDDGPTERADAGASDRPADAPDASSDIGAPLSDAVDVSEVEAAPDVDGNDGVAERPVDGGDSGQPPGGVVLIPLGGAAPSCLRVTEGAVTIADSTTCTSFVLDGNSIEGDGQCFRAQAADAGAAILLPSPCDGSIDERWSISGGHIVSLDESDGQHHCLDLLGGSHDVGTPVEVAVCNSSRSQLFWPAGPVMSIQSSFVNPNTANPECLNVLGGAAVLGALIDNTDCDGSAAQRFVFGRQGRIALADSPDFCLGLGPVANGLTPVVLQACEGIPGQAWGFEESGVDMNGNPTTGISNRASLTFLDVLFGLPDSGQTIDAFGNNGSPGQTFRPTSVAVSSNGN